MESDERNRPNDLREENDAEWKQIFRRISMINVDPIIQYQYLYIESIEFGIRIVLVRRFPRIELFVYAQFDPDGFVF